jgi:hypothetical protein
MFRVPDDFDAMFQEEIEAMFHGGSLFPEDQAAPGEAPR